MSKSPSPFRYFHSSPEVIRLVVLMYVRFPLSLRNVEDLLHERGIGCCQSDANSSPLDVALPERRISGGKALPLGEGRRAEGLVGLPVDEVALGLEMVGD